MEYLFASVLPNSFRDTESDTDINVMYYQTSDIESDWVPLELESQLSPPAAIVVIQQPRQFSAVEQSSSSLTIDAIGHSPPNELLHQQAKYQLLDATNNII